MALSLLDTLVILFCVCVVVLSVIQSRANPNAPMNKRIILYYLMYAGFLLKWRHRPTNAMLLTVSMACLIIIEFQRGMFRSKFLPAVVLVLALLISACYVVEIVAPEEMLIAMRGRGRLGGPNEHGLINE
jgi:hypothetical protein